MSKIHIVKSIEALKYPYNCIGLLRGTTKNGDVVIGNKTKIKIVKNKVAPPFKEVEFDILYGEGFSALDSLIETAVEENLIEKAGSWYSYKDEKLGQGKESVKTFLLSKPLVQNDLKNALIYDKKTLSIAEKTRNESLYETAMINISAVYISLNYLRKKKSCFN